MSFVLWGQSQNVRHIITPDGEVIHMRGQQQLFVRGYAGEPIYVADHYVAANGSDDNAGTFTEPWATWQKAFDNTAAGELTYIRGGTYQVSAIDAPGAYATLKNGTSENPICIYNYPGEIPILDMSNCTGTDQNFGVYLYDCDYWHLKGLRVTKTPHGTIDQPWSIAAHASNYITFENLVAYNNHGCGIIFGGTDHGLMLNCDSYANYDYVNNTNGNGFAILGTINTSTNTVRGCRSWDNEWGEGFGTWDVEGVAIYDSCWAWNNHGTDGDGYGFELGKTVEDQSTLLRRILTNCISAYNDSGYNQAEANVIIHLFNNVSYSNVEAGYLFASTNPDNAHIVRNNLSYLDPIIGDFHSNAIRDHNSWQDGLVVNNADFVSLATSQLLSARKANGSLPDITCFHLVTGSDLKNAGVDVGIPYLGAAPDIGCFEFIE